MNMNTLVSYTDIFTCIASAVPVRGLHKFDHHTLIYVYTGELEVVSDGRQLLINEGKCVFIAAGQMAQLSAYPKNAGEIHAVMLTIPLCFLCEFFPTIHETNKLRTKKINVMELPDLPNYQSLFRSLVPYYEKEADIPQTVFRLKMAEGIYALLATDKKFYYTLFGRILENNIDILDVVSGTTSSVLKWTAICDMNNVDLLNKKN